MFSEDAVGVLAAMGFKSLLYDREAPTPLGAFAVKTLGTAAGIVVTASHNPPEFNGYKVYQAGGTQINAPVDGQIASHIDAVAAEEKGPECLSLLLAEKQGLLSYLSTSTFDDYVQNVCKFFSVDQAADTKRQESECLKIAYTPMHGVGDPVAQALFSHAGFKQVWTVEEQRKPDGDFSTVKFPNPEEEGAMDLVHNLADKHGAAIAIANDPDADRLSVSARLRDGEMKQMTGDDIGTILGDELLRRAKGSGCDMTKVWTLSTIVSSRLLARLAQTTAARHQETLTGFKWLGAVAKQLEDAGQQFVFAYEEALGYMVTTEVWDKDGLSALLLLSLLASDLQAKDETLWTRLEEIHRSRSGVSVTFPRTIRLKPGASGAAIMRELRSNVPKSIAGQPVALVDDLLDRPEVPAKQGDIPRNDVARFYVGYAEGLTEDAIRLTLPRLIIRPSGTEPKVKIYCESRIEMLGAGQDYVAKQDELRDELEKIADAFVAVVSHD